MKSLLTRLRHWGGSLGGRGGSGDPRVDEYIAFNERRFGAQPGEESAGVVLVGLFSWYPSIHCYSHVATHLAARHGGAVRAFYFQKTKIPGTAAIFRSFGADLALTHAAATDEDRACAERKADEIFRGLKSNREVIQIAVDDVQLGDFIADTYIRYLARPTIQLDDPELRAAILDTLLIYHACRRYLAAHRVLAVIPDHTVYSQCGVLLRLATLAGIPVYMVNYSPRFLVRRLDYRLRPGERAIQTRLPYYRYRELFAALPPEQQARGREIARAALAQRLSGKVDAAILHGVSAFDAHSGERLLAETGRPRIVVLLHDFCDAAHLYRKMLFPHFMDWCHHLLSRAEETPYDWYVKPHPNNRLPARAAMNAMNDQCVKELQAKYPRVHFLPPSASNRQIVEEGVAAMFTVHGTAAHEYAYLGVPVVTAGENPQSDYRFCIHAQSIEEYDRLIAQAGELRCDIQKEDIEEFFYMYHHYFADTEGSDAHPIDPALCPWREIDARGGSPEFLDLCIRSASPERDRAVACYLDEVFTHRG